MADDEVVDIDYDMSEDDTVAEPARHPKRTHGRGGRAEVPKLTTSMEWALSRVANHVTVSDKRMVAWYLLDPQRWSFRTVADGESLIEMHASQIADLVGRTVYGQITKRPYPVQTWAEARGATPLPRRRGSPRFSSGTNTSSRRGCSGRFARQPKPKSATSRRTVSLPELVVTAIRQALDLGLDGGPDDVVFPSTRGTPRSPARIRDLLRLAQAGMDGRVTPHDFRRTVVAQVANSTSLTNATAQLGHADESTTMRHSVRRTHVAPDLRSAIDELVMQAGAEGVDDAKRGV